jgi:hypothetical protein
MTRYDFKVHPLAALFPDLSADEFDKLKRDIQANGQLEPIVVSIDGKTLLDGRHRIKACIQLDRAPFVLNFSRVITECKKGASGHELTEEEYIWSKNILRRHLTDDQRAAIGLKWADTVRDAAKQRMKDGGKGLVVSPYPVHTREVVAKKAGVSTNKVRQAESVARHAPELLPKIESGEVKLKDAVKEAEAERVKLKRKGPADTVERIRKSHPERIVDVEPDAFDEPLMLSALYKIWEGSVAKNWPENRDLTPVIRKVYAFATYLEKLGKVRAANLQKKVQAVGVGVQ